MNLSDLQAATDYSSISSLFGVPEAALKRNLYGVRGYRSFAVAKKAGGVRQLAAPNRMRKKLQRQLLPVLTALYRVKPCVHGFASHRSIATNASMHVGKRTIVNIDLADFFPSISYQRVRGVFLASPLQLSWTAANILAQMCCDQGALPAGGVTSPVLSNIICARLDKKLDALCRRLGGAYTRYADDMTMSFDRSVADISPVVSLDSLGVASPGSAINHIVNEEGFSINPSKFRVATDCQRKIVTGLVVNERVNVRRSWYLRLESSVYAIEKFGLKHIAASDYPDLDIDVACRRLLRRIHGKLAYYRMVRGPGDWLAADLASRFNAVHDDQRLRVPDVESISNATRYSRGALVVIGYDAPIHIFEETPHQGSGFVTNSGLIVTVFHVISNDGGVLPHIYVMNERKLSLVECRVLAKDETSDVAVLQPLSSQPDLTRVRFRIGPDLVAGDSVSAVGYPSYEYSDGHVLVRGEVTRVRAATRVAGAKGFIDAPLQGGMSGGPVVGQDDMVRGVVHRDDTGAGGIAEAVQISEVIRLAISNGLTL